MTRQGTAYRARTVCARDRATLDSGNMDMTLSPPARFPAGLLFVPFNVGATLFSLFR